jgi:hypothetical protein
MTDDCLDMQLRKGCEGIGMWYIVEPTGQSLASYLSNVQIKEGYNWHNFRLVARKIYNMLICNQHANVIHRNFSVDSVVLPDTMLPGAPVKHLYLLDHSVACSPGCLDDKRIGDWMVQSPEQTKFISNDCGNGLGIDIYSFGILLWECLPKPRFIRGNSMLCRLKFPAGVDPSIRTMVLRCLHPQPEKRPLISEVKDCLEKLQRNPAPVLGLLSDNNCYLCNSPAVSTLLACSHKCACEECFEFLHQCPSCLEPIVEHDRNYFMEMEEKVFSDLYGLGHAVGYSGDYILSAIVNRTTWFFDD